MAKAVMAWRTGKFRCSGIGKTKYARAGEELPAHTSCQGGCEWEFREEDNPHPESAIVIIGGDTFFFLVIPEVPKVGDTLNLTDGLVGNYRVMELDTVQANLTRGKALYPWPRIMVERIGEHEEGQRIYAVGEVLF